ncbi:MAG: FAD-binding protein [Deltaproteobacteria bacterium]|nr:MAG: FAD-binding protein [Deltaproteobacteria bacterium]
MALTADVVVVGGGMAGVCASLAAREKGAKVLLVARASGATALSSGAIDFGGAVADATVGEGARAVSRQPGHPYALLGDALPALLERTMAFLRRHLVSLGLEGARVAADKCLWLPTPVGTARPAALVQSSIAGADLRNLSSRPARLAVIAFAGAQQVEAGLVASGLSRLLAPLGEAVAAPIDLYRTREDALRSIAELARDLDRPGRRDLFAARPTCSFPRSVSPTPPSPAPRWSAPWSGPSSRRSARPRAFPGCGCRPPSPPRCGRPVCGPWTASRSGPATAACRSFAASNASLCAPERSSWPPGGSSAAESAASRARVCCTRRCSIFPPSPPAAGTSPRCPAKSCSR